MCLPREAVVPAFEGTAPGPLGQDRCAAHGCRSRVAGCGGRAVAGAALPDVFLAGGATLVKRLSKEVVRASGASRSHPVQKFRTAYFQGGAGRPR